MPGHKDAKLLKTKEEEEKEMKKRKPSKMSFFENKKNKISESMMKKLKEHSKLHKGGMNSKHMKNMVKFVKMGDTFSAAHKKAVKLDNGGKKSTKAY